MLIWNIYIVYDAPFASASIGVNTTRYGYDFNKKCMIGIPYIETFNCNTPYYRFDLDPNVGVVNGASNAISNFAEIQTVCFKDWTCPSTHPYK